MTNILLNNALHKEFKHLCSRTQQRTIILTVSMLWGKKQVTITLFLKYWVDQKAPLVFKQK